MINLKTSKKTPTITVGVNPVITNVVNAPSTQQPPDGELIARDVTLTEPVDELTAERRENSDLKRQIEVLKLIIEIQQSNPLVVNKYIIADDEVLERMISLLCNAEAVQIDAEDLGSGCMTKHVYRKVESIYVTVGGKTLNLKYDFPAVMKTLKDLHISTKFVF
jgi:hypothetical protein